MVSQVQGIHPSFGVPIYYIARPFHCYISPLDKFTGHTYTNLLFALKLDDNLGFLVL